MLSGVGVSFPRRPRLWNIARAEQNIRRRGRVVLVNGPHGCRLHASLGSNPRSSEALVHLRGPRARRRSSRQRTGRAFRFGHPDASLAPAQMYPTRHRRTQNARVPHGDFKAAASQNSHPARCGRIASPHGGGPAFRQSLRRAATRRGPVHGGSHRLLRDD